MCVKHTYICAIWDAMRNAHGAGPVFESNTNGENGAAKKNEYVRNPNHIIVVSQDAPTPLVLVYSHSVLAEPTSAMLTKKEKKGKKKVVMVVEEPERSGSQTTRMYLLYPPHFASGTCGKTALQTAHKPNE